MPVSVTMPRLGESVTEGTVTRWLKQEGDQVEADEPLLEVSTDKVDTEIPSPAAGVLTRIVVQEDETAEVGAELAVIGDSGDAAGAAPAEEPAAAEPAEEPAEEPAATEEPAAEQQAEPAAEQQAEPAAEQQPAPAAGKASGETTSLKMPALGESVTEGTVTRWLKQVGDAVEADEPLLEVSTDKVDTEIPSPVAGTLLEIKVAEDETVEVGAELAVIGAAGAEAGGSQPAQHAPADEAQPEQQAQPAQQVEPKAEKPEAKPEPKQAAAPAQAAAPQPAQPAQGQAR